MIHFPTAEITQLLIKLSKNPKFLQMGRILMLMLVALTAIGHSSVWVIGSEAWMPGCTIPKWGCYIGPSLSLTEYVDLLGASRFLLLLPVIDLFSAILLLIQPPRTYLFLLIMSLFSFFFPLLGGDPSPYTNVLSGDGYWLSLISLMLLSLLTFSLAVAEQSGKINKKKTWQADWGLKIE